MLGFLFFFSNVNLNGEPHPVVADGLSKLIELDIPFRRPEDYFAEMVKTDVHMEKVGIHGERTGGEMLAE